MSNNNWANMNYDDLKVEIERAIIGQGMGASTQYLHFIPDYFDNIGELKIKEDVLKIITEIAEDFEDPTSSRAIYLLGELPIPNKELKFIEMARRLDPILEKIIGSKEVPESCMKYLAYLCELNKIIGKLNLIEAKSFLEKQAKFLLRSPMPKPNSNEHYVYYLSAKSAEASLNILKP